LLLPFLWKRGLSIICFLPLAKSWAPWPSFNYVLQTIPLHFAGIPVQEASWKRRQAILTLGLMLGDMLENPGALPVPSKTGILSLKALAWLLMDESPFR
jgi:hypothetical protein